MIIVDGYKVDADFVIGDPEVVCLTNFFFKKLFMLVLRDVTTYALFKMQITHNSNE